MVDLVTTETRRRHDVDTGETTNKYNETIYIFVHAHRLLFYVKKYRS